MSDEDDIDGMQDAGVALVRAYNYISDEVDSQSAFEAIISVSFFHKHSQDTYNFYTKKYLTFLHMVTISSIIMFCFLFHFLVDV